MVKIIDTEYDNDGVFITAEKEGKSYTFAIGLCELHKAQGDKTYIAALHIEAAEAGRPYAQAVKQGWHYQVDPNPPELKECIQV